MWGLVLVAVSVSLITQGILLWYDQQREAFVDASTAISHFFIDEGNISQEGTISKIVPKPALVIRNLSNGTRVNGDITVVQPGYNMNGVRITGSGSTVKDSPTWGIEISKSNGALFRHYSKGVHPTSMTSDAEVASYLGKWNWFLHLLPNFSYSTAQSSWLSWRGW